MSSFLNAYPPFWYAYGLGLLVLTTLASWSFVILYSVKYKWWSNEFGRHLVAMSTCLSLFLTYYLVVAVFPALPAKGAIRLILFTLLALTIHWRFWLFFRVARAQERSKRESR